VSLNKQFKSASNLGVIAKKWFAALEVRFKASGIEPAVKTGLDGAASLLAPAALVAQAIGFEQLNPERALRVLVLTDDPVAVMDEGIWLGFTADLAGTLPVDLYCTCDKVIHSSLYENALELGLRGYTTISVSDAQSQAWDLAFWIHPAIEAGESGPIVDLTAQLHEAGTPIYACMYNELDALIQSHGIASKGLEFSWLDSPIANARLSKASVNKFGIATAEVGIEGGWGVVLTKLQSASAIALPGDWDFIRVAMSLFRLEGSTSATWCLGQIVAGISFGKSEPIGLIGNLAVDPKTGMLLSECPTTKVLNSVGHLWTDELAALPETNFQLVPWAARVRLAFNNYLTREEKKRVETIAMLDEAFSMGMVEAGIALARGYERVGIPDAQEKARKIYTTIGATHPMSAYYLAHDSLARGDESECIRMLKTASAAGYVPAITDLGIIMKESGDLAEADRLLDEAIERGDPEAAFRKGEMLIAAGAYESALESLRKAWSKSHVDALNTAHWLCTQLLNRKIGKSGHLKRELKDVCYVINKRIQYAGKLESDVA
jgi:hypothetical protein